MGPPVEGHAWREGLSLIDQSWVEAALEGMPIMPEERDPLLVEREKTHGSFGDNARISQALKAVLKQNSLGLMKVEQVEALDMICLKISRIASGQASYKDHWDDIAGYAKLGSEACE